MAAAWLLVVAAGLWWLWSWLVAVNLVTFALYGWDKAAARRPGTFRIPEFALHVPMALGGTVGAWVGRTRFRHKTVKPRFVLVFRLLVAAQALMAAIAVWGLVLR